MNCLKMISTKVAIANCITVLQVTEIKCYRQIFIPLQSVPYANIFRDVTNERVQPFLPKIMCNDVYHSDQLFQ